MKKKLLMFLLLLFCLIPLTGCPPKRTFPNLLVYELNEEKELIDNKVQYYVGHTFFFKNNYDKQYNNYWYTDFCIGMKIDNNESFYIKYEVPNEDVLNMKYYTKDSGIEGFKETSKYEFNLAGIEVVDKVVFQFSCIKYTNQKFIYEYEFEASSSNNKIIVNDVHYREISMGLNEEDKIYVQEYY